MKLGADGMGTDINNMPAPLARGAAETLVSLFCYQYLVCKTFPPRSVGSVVGLDDMTQRNLSRLLRWLPYVGSASTLSSPALLPLPTGPGRLADNRDREVVLGPLGRCSFRARWQQGA